MHGDRSEEHREIAVCNNFFKFSTTKIVIHDEIYSFNMSRHSHLSLSHDEWIKLIALDFPEARKILIFSVNAFSGDKRAQIELWEMEEIGGKETRDI